MSVTEVLIAKTNMTRMRSCAQQVEKTYQNEFINILASRAPPEETSAFLTALLAAHGSNFFVRLFGQRARNSLSEMGGIDRVSVSLSRK